MTKAMTDIDMAVRCLDLAELIAGAEAEVLKLQAKIVRRDDDDDSVELARIADLRAEIGIMQNEQSDLSEAMTSQPDLGQVVTRHAKKAAKAGKL